MATFRKVSFAGHNRDFHDELNRRVDRYFADHNIPTTADWRFNAKAVFYYSAFTATWAALMFGGFSTGVALALCVLQGIIFATLGFNVGHDAIHGATSRKGWVNSLLSTSFDLVGASSTTWSVAHNFVHHTYTNIVGVDHDLDPGPVMKFHQAPNPARIYRLQFIYMWLMYGFTTLIWIVKKDIQQIFAPDPRTGKRAPALDIAKVFGAKAMYTALFIVTPLLVVDRPLWQLLIGTLALHAAAGTTLAITFQLAHCVERTAFPEPGADNKINDSWAAHQLRTTANFGGSNPFIGFLVGGLDHQVEHHLFPKICHVHYAALSPIVRQCAHEHGLPYLENPSFFGALLSHIRVMYRFGRPAVAVAFPATISTNAPRRVPALHLDRGDRGGVLAAADRA